MPAEAMRLTFDVQDSARLLIGGPLVLLTTRWRDQTNVMPAIWTTPLSRDPPLVGVAIHASRHTHDMVRFAEEFALNVPGRDLINHSHYFGMVSARDLDKLTNSKLDTFKANKIDVPLIGGCVAYIECGLEDALRIGDHTLFVGRVVAVQAEQESFNESWLLTDDDYKPLHYLGGDRYALLSGRLQAELRTSDEGALELGESADEREQRQEEEARQRELEAKEGAEE